jgi:hypothetical protein
MGKIIVMKRTIDWLATSKQFDAIDRLMGVGLDWQTINMKDESTYYKLN